MLERPRLRHGRGQAAGFRHCEAPEPLLHAQPAGPEALVATLCGGIVATGWQAHIAGLERARAERHFDEVRKLANVFMFDVHGAIADLPGSTPARQMLVENSLKYLEALSAESANEASAGSGDSRAATDAARHAVALAESLAAAAGATAEDRRNRATALLSLGWQLSRSNQVSAGVLFMKQGVAAYEKLLAAQPGDVTIRQLLALAYGRIGEALLDSTTRYADALEVHENGYEIARTLSDNDPRNTRLRKITSYALLGMGGALMHLDRPSAALERQLQAAWRGMTAGRSAQIAQELESCGSVLTAAQSSTS